MKRLLGHRRIFQKLRRNEGQSALEFLLVFPVLLLFLLLLVDLGVMMYEYVSVSNAVREGARYAAVNCGDGNCTGGSIATTPAQRTVDRSSGFLTSGEVTVQWTGTNRGDAVVVHALHPYDFLFFPGFSIDVKSCSEMRLEQRDNGSITATASATC
jgi:Flp pilus assembly protein TadG